MADDDIGVFVISDFNEPDSRRRQNDSEKLYVPWWKFLLMTWGIISFFTSLTSDIKLIMYYVRYKDYKFLSYSLTFMIIPLLASMLFCFYFDVHKPGIHNQWPRHWLSKRFRELMVVAQLGPALRKFDVVLYCIKLNYTDDHDKKVKYASFIRSAKWETQSMSLIRGFLKSSPLLVLTGYIMFQTYNYDNELPGSVGSCDQLVYDVHVQTRRSGSRLVGTRSC